MPRQPISDKWRTRLTGADPQNPREMPPLVEAARTGTLPELFENFPKGMDLPADIQTRWVESMDTTFLHEAARGGNMDQVADLADTFGFDFTPALGAKNYQMDTPLHAAARSGHMAGFANALKRMELSAGSLVDGRNYEGSSALTLSAAAGKLDDAIAFTEKTGLNFSEKLLDPNLVRTATAKGQMTPLRTLFPGREFSWTHVKETSLKFGTASELYGPGGEHFRDLLAAGCFKSKADLKDFKTGMPEESLRNFKKNTPLMKAYAGALAKARRRDIAPPGPLRRPGRE